MKFEIATFLTYDPFLGNPSAREAMAKYSAVCRVFPWSFEDPIMAYGPTREAAKEKLLEKIQRHVDGSYKELEVETCEVEVKPTADPIQKPSIAMLEVVGYDEFRDIRKGLYPSGWIHPVNESYRCSIDVQTPDGSICRIPVDKEILDAILRKQDKPTG